MSDNSIQLELPYCLLEKSTHILNQSCEIWTFSYDLEVHLTLDHKSVRMPHNIKMYIMLKEGKKSVHISPS